LLITEDAYNQHLKEIAATLTPELLQQVKYLVELCGWSVDFIETARFVEWCLFKQFLRLERSETGRYCQPHIILRLL
jgi:uncharacterized protein YeaC (DUF1315 family)